MNATAQNQTTLFGVSTKKFGHCELILDGCATNCAHCGMKLTDAISIERALGPNCSKKGYDEDPVRSDEAQAFIDICMYPQLIDFLIQNYKPLGVRGLMNGLVKVCALNRKVDGLHDAICNSIASLGYNRLSSVLRESIVTIEVKDSKDPDYLQVWVKKSEWTFAWLSDLRYAAGMGRFDRFRRSDNGRGILFPKANKRALWDTIKKHFDGKSIKTETEIMKIVA